MKTLVRLVVLAAAAFALSGTRGADVLSDNGICHFEESILVQDDGQKDADWFNRTALRGSGLEFSAARPGSSAPCVRHSSGKTNSLQRHSRTGFLHNGKIVCTAHPGNFMLDCIAAPVSGALSGRSAVIALEHLLI